MAYERCEEIKLKKVLGLTVCSNAALDVSPTNGVLAYPAGCTVVLFNAKKLTQSYLVNTSRKAITAVAYSQCGRYVATGECGISPAIKVWELDGQSSNGEGGTGGTVVAEFLGHKYAVSCIAFSPTGKYLVSVGSQHDMIVNVFDWKVNLKIASNKVSAKVAAVSFSADGNYFVTVGNRHVKYWYLEGSRKYKEPIPLMGRSAILGELRDNDFCAVACGKGDCSDSTYAITRVGHLVEFNSRRLLDKWVACRTTSANCICANAHYILVGCAEAIIRIFNAATLEYVTTLPRTHYLGVEVSSGVHINHIMTAPQSARYPDTIAMVFDEVRSKVACVYNDHSLYIWDLRDVRRVGKSHSFLYHSACIWGVETVPLDLENNTNPALPESCFLTCSSDDTIRVWGLDDCPNTDVYRKNIYSKELLKVVYIDNELNFIKDTDNPILSTEKTSSYDGRNGVRCIKINSEKNHLATGDRSGNIRIYNLVTLKQITMIEAHDSEVLCLEYTHEKIEKKLLASASRDRLIHVFDVNQGYNILQTLDDHSSSITSVKFIGTGNNFQMISCGADKSIMFRAFQNNQFLRGTNCSGKTTLYDMEVDSNGKHILTACQDRNIRVYGTHNAKHTKTFKGSHSDDGSLIKLSLDPSGIYIATSCTDKTLSVYDYYSNECMARMYGHSELVTGLRFTNDCKYLISASGDGCVFIWQIPHDMIVTMQARLSQQRLRSGHMPIPRPVSNSVTDIIIDSPTRDHEQFSSSPSHLFIEDAPLTPGYRFSDVGQLPQWAKRKGQDEPQANSSIALSSSPSQSQMVKPRGRWAQRGQDPDPLDLRGTADSSLSSTYTNAMQTSDYNSGSSKDIYNQANLSEDSSIDSGMENRKDKPFRTKIVGEQKKGTSLRFESNNDHDGDVEDISDGERTSSDHGMMFYQNAGPSTPTDFKVNAMNEDELRKSVRRQKFEKLGLALKASEQSAPSTGTGTGTSDTEDEGSTPSGENADRSLASTLGGSSESIPQQASSSFLQAALDGPGSLSDRSDKKRRSISAKHNTESKSSTSYSKFYTNSKKEELLKVINEAKAKLENVGYRSNLRGSQSISDLTHASNTTETTLRVSRINRTGEHYNNASSTKPLIPYNYFHCAAPRSVLSQNYNTISTLRSIYPPYPTDIGVYNNSNNSSDQADYDVPAEQPTKTRPSNLDLNSLKPESADSSLKSRKHPSILKNYKSCPVSPVHEEMDWSNLPQNTGSIVFNEPKRHSMYSDDAKTILDMIHSDTEKMIAEITQKYGDLEKFDPISDLPDPPTMTLSTENVNRLQDKPLEKEHGFLSDEDGNFSSDSLEDCSLDLDVQKPKSKMFKKHKTVCKKHQQRSEKSNSLPKRSVSDYFIYEEFYQPQYRNVSLSDILKEDDNKENMFLETQRHSSASFFLVQYPDQKSQESILTDNLSGISCYNSMESILSDESDCKSAPLEMLFNKRKKDMRLNQETAYFDKVDTSSKSYGSSPNASSGFDYYMQQRYADNSTHYDISNYDLEGFYESGKYFNTGKTSLTTSQTYPRFETLQVNDDIPTLSYKNAEYSSSVSKSLSKEFAHQRSKNNSNPIYIEKDEICRQYIDINNPTIGRPFQNDSIYVMKKSCSFEIEMNENRRCSRSTTKRFERNLEKFESDHGPSKVSAGGPTGPIEMNYCPHKPPVAARRSSSMRSRSRSRTKERYNTVGQIDFQPEKRPTNEVRDFVNKELHSSKKERNDEKSFEIFISERGNSEDDNMDSLELYKKPNLHKENSLDSLDEPTQKSLKNSQNEKTCVPSNLSTKLDDTEYSKFQDIEKKIQIINKLVEMEESRLEKERIQKENRLKPFECNSKEGGYVRSLTRNFDRLARNIEEEIELERNRQMAATRLKRNYSLPDVLEGAKFELFEFTIEPSNNVDDAESEKILADFLEKDKGNPKSLMSVNNDDSPIRRACSLSDLSLGKGATKPTATTRTNVPVRTPSKRQTSVGPKSSSNLGSRSNSVGVLNQSDSETDTLTSRGGIMRPTLSSQNRANSTGVSRQYPSKSNATTPSRRKGLQNSYSSVNLSTPAQDDSSSEEAQSGPPSSSKPAVPPRPRSMMIDHKKSSISTGKLRGNTDSFGGGDLSMSPDSTSQLCSNIISMLNTTTNAVLQLHSRLKHSDETSGSRNNNLMLKELENAVIMTQNMLTKITNKSDNNNMHVSFAPNEQHNSLENGDYLLMMNKCADLLNKVRNKHKSNDCENET
ncbi:unnamed protein product [Hermetia illucens]|uniref:MABP1/WDR62 second WD40 domain-containing protein n=1 Tax=Hermetia illucens TaxID=343691 RepID=A0A7R8UFN3_HERIL|nr:unnamed protein product [Hermetia illucens]